MQQTYVSIPKTEPNRSLHLAYGIDDFKRKLRPTAYAPTILVGPFIRVVLQELLDKEPICGMYFDAIEFGLVYGIAYCRTERIDIPTNFGYRKRSGRNIRSREFNIRGRYI
jgi:hypothetical protein